MGFKEVSLSLKRKLGRHGLDVVFSSRNNQLKIRLGSTKDLSPEYTKFTAPVAEKYTSENQKQASTEESEKYSPKYVYLQKINFLIKLMETGLHFYLLTCS